MVLYCITLRILVYTVWIKILEMKKKNPFYLEICWGYTNEFYVRRKQKPAFYKYVLMLWTYPENFSSIRVVVPEIMAVKVSNFVWVSKIRYFTTCSYLDFYKRYGHQTYTNDRSWQKKKICDVIDIMTSQMTSFWWRHNSSSFVIMVERRSFIIRQVDLNCELNDLSLNVRKFYWIRKNAPFIFNVSAFEI